MAKNRITAIDENTWCIEESNGMVYGFLLAGRDRAVLLDTGFGTCDYKKMAASVTALPVDVINTHGHLDHVSQNYAFDRAYLHPADETVFREHTDAAMRLGYIRMLLREAKLPAFLVDSGLVKLLTKKVCEILESVVGAPGGTGKNASVAGYRVAGKTATSEKVGQASDEYMVSFVGFAPADDPKVAVLVILDNPDPTSGIYISGGQMAAPVVGNILADILPYLGVQENSGSVRRSHPISGDRNSRS